MNYPITNTSFWRPSRTHFSRTLNLRESTSVSPRLTKFGGCGAPSFLGAVLSSFLSSPPFSSKLRVFGVTRSSSSSLCLLSTQDAGFTLTLEQLFKYWHDVQFHFACRQSQLTTILHPDPFVQLQHDIFLQGDVNLCCLIIGGFVSGVTLLLLGLCRSDGPSPWPPPW